MQIEHFVLFLIIAFNIIDAHLLNKKMMMMMEQPARLPQKAYVISYYI